MIKMSASEILSDLAQAQKLSISSVDFAKFLDENDNMKHLRKEFFYPLKKTLPRVEKTYINDDEESVYMCGHSLGLMPKLTPVLVQQELTKWANMGVDGHAHGDLPWQSCDELVVEQSCKLVGAKKGEVALMNSLTVNEHLLLISFYRPTSTRYKILLEEKAFPSDHYCVQSQIQQRGLDPAKCMLFARPRENEVLLRTEDILKILDAEGDKISVVLLPGVHFATGQVLDMAAITKHAQSKGCYVGFDLAHAVGNVPIFLDEWGVDFACWCTYKYLCSGAGGIGGFYINEKYDKNDFPKLLGWWSHKFETRFVMDNVLDLSAGAFGYRVSNPPGLLVACLKAYLQVMDQTSMVEFRTKSKLLTAYMERLISAIHLPPKNNAPLPPQKIVIITPQDEEKRGCQLSIKLPFDALRVYLEMISRGVMIDKRGDQILRVSANPLYNSFQDVYKMANTLQEVLLVVGENTAVKDAIII